MVFFLKYLSNLQPIQRIPSLVTPTHFITAATKLNELEVCVQTEFLIFNYIV